MTMLLENPWPAGLIGAITLVGCMVAFVQTGVQRYLVGAGLALLIGGGLVLLELLLVTPAEEVEHTVGRISAAMLAGDTNTLLAQISDREPAIESAARGALSRFEITKANFNSLTVTMNNAVDPPQARADFVANIHGRVRAAQLGEMRGGQPYRVTLHFRRDAADGPWQMFDYELRDYVNNTPLEIPR